MSVKLICTPEFFNGRLSSHLGLSGCVKPGTTYFLCNDLTEVPNLVSTQDPFSLTALSEGKKVQLLICKEKAKIAKVSKQEAVLETSSVVSGSSPIQSSVTKMVPSTRCTIRSPVERVKLENIRTVTTTSDIVIINKEEKASIPPAITPVINLPLFRVITSGTPIVSSTHLPESHVSGPSNIKTEDGTSQQDNESTDSNLPCRELRHELKQVILRRRENEGKTEIDLEKLEEERQAALQGIKLTREDLDKRVQKRASNNIAARKSREKRKIRERSLTEELQGLIKHRKKLNEALSTLEQQQKFLRLWATGNRKVDDKASKEMMRSVINSEIVIPEYHSKIKEESDDFYANSAVVSSSEYNSDDTRNGFDLESSQDTYDSFEGSSGVDYSEMTLDEMQTAYAEHNSEIGEAEKNMFKEVKIECENSKLNTDSDSDVELIEIDKPLVIDVD